MKKRVVDPTLIVNPDPKRAIVYIRVSKNLELQELGAQAQRNSCQRWAEAHGVQIMAVVEDEFSGGKRLEKRKNLHLALDLMREHRTQLLLCSKVDRFGRNMFEALKARELIEKRGGKLAFAEGISPTGDPANELMFTTMLSFAQYELAMIRNRTKAARAVLLERGLFPGGQVPFGYRKVQREGKVRSNGKPIWYLEPDEQEQKGIARARELLSLGYSIGACARIVAKEGLLTSSRSGDDGKPVSAASIFKLLRKEIDPETSAVPFGYKIDEGQLVEKPEEQAVLAMLLQLHRLGVGLHAIASALCRQGVLTRSGKPPSWYWVRCQLEALGRQTDLPVVAQEVPSLAQHVEGSVEEPMAAPA